MYTVIIYQNTRNRVFCCKKGGTYMKVINITPDKDGKMYIKLYGEKYEIVINKPKTPKSE